MRMETVLVMSERAATAQAAQAALVETTDNRAIPAAQVVFGAGAVAAATIIPRVPALEAARRAKRLSPIVIPSLGLAAITVVRSKEWCSKKLKA